MEEHCQEVGARARVGGIGGQVLGRGATAPPPPIAEHTRTPQRTTDSEKPGIQMGDGKKNRGAIGKENGNLRSTEGTNESRQDGVQSHTTLLPGRAGLPEPVEPLFI